MSLSLPKLDPKEEHFCIASCIEGLTLFLRYMPPNAHQTDTPKIVLYVHGGSFPSALSIAHRFDGRSWRDELADAGFHVWGLDFHGFGASDPYPEMAEPAECNPVLGRAEANRSNGPYVSSATIMACRKSRSSRIPGARSQSVDLPEDAPILSIGLFSSDRSRGAKRRRSLRLLLLGVSSR
jgi:pimeloyl-ACP methyl ester carboxylesterase